MKKNDMRLISIVMGEDTKENRSNDTVSMMEYGFSQYGVDNVLKKNKFSESIFISNAKTRNVKYYLSDDVNIIAKKSIKDVEYKIEKELYEVKAPLKKNSVIGKLKLKYDNNTYTYDLIVKDEVKKSSWFNVFENILVDIVSGTKLTR